MVNTITDDFNIKWSFYPESRCLIATEQEGIPEELPCPWEHAMASTLRKHGRLSLNTPPAGAKTELFASVKEDWCSFYHIYASRMAVSVCGVKAEDIVPVVVCEQVGGGHWGWWDHEHQAFTMVWPSKTQVEMCFPYGYRVAEYAGDGVLVELLVKKR
jgi:hypothetical protein